ncbi:hypothetical protein [Methylobacterium marchantiae]|uniref:Uncharacterized protein n=1 Tax=Methylobacterium marchantiae TaxID=600331 RepID=A0ABW3WZ82_9HYPH|nr:hypothetical protein AIGOOFII_2014 [Methylobacterium marchantiae]
MLGLSPRNILIYSVIFLSGLCFGVIYYKYYLANTSFIAAAPNPIKFTSDEPPLVPSAAPDPLKFQAHESLESKVSSEGLEQSATKQPAPDLTPKANPSQDTTVNPGFEQRVQPEIDKNQQASKGGISSGVGDNNSIESRVITLKDEGIGSGSTGGLSSFAERPLHRKRFQNCALSFIKALNNKRDNNNVDIRSRGVVADFYGVEWAGEEFTYNLKILGPSRLLSQSMAGYWEKLRLRFEGEIKSRSASKITIIYRIFTPDSQIVKEREDTVPPDGRYAEMDISHVSNTFEFQNKIATWLQECLGRGDK